jgi:hypothetical protein
MELIQLVMVFLKVYAHLLLVVYGADLKVVRAELVAREDLSLLVVSHVETLVLLTFVLRIRYMLEAEFNIALELLLIVMEQ